jgi:hypothetical protein
MEEIFVVCEEKRGYKEGAGSSLSGMILIELCGES